jgi:hypothetical protein
LDQISNLKETTELNNPTLVRNLKESIGFATFNMSRITYPNRLVTDEDEVVDAIKYDNYPHLKEFLKPKEKVKRKIQIVS